MKWTRLHYPFKKASFQQDESFILKKISQNRAKYCNKENQTKAKKQTNDHFLPKINNQVQNLNGQSVLDNFLGPGFHCPHNVTCVIQGQGSTVRTM